ncbi:hypothetical protein B0J12DRAFT_274452 [Macrophomina phaseolina]|uniref:Uncharacterized protein n=1 Tax=Macrophomina phaseolina TaxID=35725 RepID=A0ABQ8G0L7_9PEZI|nr:hypothetical protein B0J12DRAFT_274452 [Macrophomina phaseolina]
MVSVHGFQDHSTAGKALIGSRRMEKRSKFGMTFEPGKDGRLRELSRIQRGWEMDRKENKKYNIHANELPGYSSHISTKTAGQAIKLQGKRKRAHPRRMPQKQRRNPLGMLRNAVAPSVAKAGRMAAQKPVSAGAQRWCISTRSERSEGRHTAKWMRCTRMADVEGEVALWGGYQRQQASCLAPRAQRRVNSLKPKYRLHRG